MTDTATDPKIFENFWQISLKKFAGGERDA
jgi:hypothetical protein